VSEIAATGGEAFAVKMDVADAEQVEKPASNNHRKVWQAGTSS